jgi:hypothetical protein
MALPDTRKMRAVKLAEAFNTCTERRKWRATVGGTRVRPEVHFISTGTMVRITYHLADECFTVSFSRASVAFGDFMASTYRDLSAVLAALKASGYPFSTAVEDTAVLRIEYDPRTKVATVAVALHGDDWQHAEPLPFKVPDRLDENNTQFPVDL